MNPQIRAEMLVGLLHRPACDGRHTRGMPVEPKHASERLKPPWVRQSPQHLHRTILIHHRHGYRAGESPHALEQPRRGRTGMQWKLGKLTAHFESIAARAERLEQRR